MLFSSFRNSREALPFILRRFSPSSSSSSSPSHSLRFFFSSSAAAEPPSPPQATTAAMAEATPKDEAYLNAVIPKRIQLFESIKAQQQVERLSLQSDPIKITLPDGTVKEGKKWVTSPFDVAKEISKSLAANALISQVNGVLWDMTRPLEGDCELKLFTFESDEGRDTFWHSSAHILGQALEMEYGCKLCIGPCTTRGEGFYYDAYYGDFGLNDKNLKKIDAGASKAAKVKQPFERIEVSREQALEMFSDNSFKATYWRGNKDRESLQRVYGISYPDKKHLEVLSPNMYNMQLWETSGHAANYKENMFVFEIEKQEFGLKPMNCPGHCLMFQHRVRSYRELPLRLADFGVLHRNEASGALTGLTRVRRFQQDDSHIFCRESQIKEEVRGVLEFIKYCYDVFGFTFDLKLSTRPEKYLGELATWEKAEAALTEALNEFGKPWQINEGDGAFYGPKIDISVSDALNRKFQCATLQLDFQLPARFELYYSAEDEAKREAPVMIHRAVLGSVERMFAILLEHYKGKWPFWLSPRQAIVCPVSEKSQSYALKVRDQIHDAGYYVDVDTTDRKIQKKVREAQLAQYNFILVVGEEEANTGQVSVRLRNSYDHSVMSMEELLQHFKAETEAFH
ncbi:Threonine--tRNA ligase [Morus notabilis]|uniref:threonine--tRNA ligase n=1 Tax=Morus notabilis TaxID=981085 RepID=W9RCY1_9ROSA|nr:Threonine--tRNA ligase [Morus notabilis]